ncbi:unnamed protein product [Polarella glacialis]|uniref:Uncharacterized protein n=1 Tax=Polarella glacialis TaxID=89957 RepID=A0A813LWN6_POLGL|nr:unnamed protein product [Polarella glacialis]
MATTPFHSGLQSQLQTRKIPETSQGFGRARSGSAGRVLASSAMATITRLAKGRRGSCQDVELLHGMTPFLFLSCCFAAFSRMSPADTNLLAAAT